MYIICSGKTSEVLSEFCTEDLNVPVLGVDLNDLILTLKNRGATHFDSVNKVIITDGALESLLEIDILNNLESLKGDIVFLNRFSNVTNTKVLSEKIKVFPVKEVLLSDIKRIILEGY